MKLENRRKPAVSVIEACRRIHRAFRIKERVLRRGTGQRGEGARV